MPVIALCTACFSRAKINKKNFGHLALRFGSYSPYFECSGAGTVKKENCGYQLLKFFLLTRQMNRIQFYRLQAGRSNHYLYGLVFPSLVVVILINK